MSAEPKFTPGPWHVCNKGNCSCFTVMCGDHPIAEVTHGDWGDDYPSIRLVGESSLELKAEAFMEQITYGSVSDETARANWKLISSAPELFNSLAAMTKRYVELVASGDCGFWDGNEDVCVKAAHAALSKAIGGAA